MPLSSMYPTLTMDPGLESLISPSSLTPYTGRYSLSSGLGSISPVESEAPPSPTPETLPQVDVTAPRGVSTSLSQPRSTLSTFDKILAILGGPETVKFVAQRERQQILGPVQYEFGIKFTEALRQGDFTGANKLVESFGKYAHYSPEAFQVYGKAKDEFNKRYADYQANKALVDTTLPLMNPKSSGAQWLRDIYPHLGRFSPETLQKHLEKFALEGQVDGGVLTLREKLSGRLLESQALPAGMQAGDWTAQDRLALTDAGIPISLATNIRRKQAVGEALTPAEAFVAKQLEGILKTSTDISEAERLGTGPQMQTGVVPGTPASRRAVGLPPRAGTSPTGTPPPSPSPEGQALFDSNVRAILERRNKGEITPQEAQQLILAEVDSMASTVPQGRVSPQAPISPLAQGSIDVAAEKTRREEEQRQRTRLKEEPSSEQQVHYRWENGRLVTPGRRLTQAEVQSGKWFTAGIPTEQNKLITRYAATANQGKRLLQDVQGAGDVAVGGDFWSGLFKSLGRVIGEGGSLPLGFNGNYLTIPGVGQVAFTPEQKRLYMKLTAFAQQAESVLNPEGQAQPQVGIAKSLISGATAGREGITNAINDVLDIMSDRISGMVTLPEGNYGPGPRVPQVPPRVSERTGEGRTQAARRKVEEYAPPPQSGVPFSQGLEQTLGPIKAGAREVLRIMDEQLSKIIPRAPGVPGPRGELPRKEPTSPYAPKSTDMPKRYTYFSEGVPVKDRPSVKHPAPYPQPFARIR